MSSSLRSMSSLSRKLHTASRKDVSSFSLGLTTTENLFNFLLANQNVFKSVEEFLLLTVNKCLGNFACKDKLVSKFSIFLIKTVVLKLKDKVSKENFNNLKVCEHISRELVKINESSLADPQFYKLRSELYEVISICYLSDSYKDYIPNIHAVLNQIHETNMKGDNLKVI